MIQFLQNDQQDATV